jgi:3-hydroxyisobutyrate dehydrogenase/2-hydroxy-3-oxopropionate reductase
MMIPGGTKCVAVIGLGSMGRRIATRLLNAGYELIVWNRSREKALPLLERGAVLADTPAEAAARAAVLITMLADPAALRAVTEGEEGIAAGAAASLTVIEMSTVGPAGIAWLSAALPAGVGLLDAPVLGSVGAAEAGSLVVIVGGPTELVERWRELLSTLGSPIHVGPLGSGQAAKMVANATHFATLATLGEVIGLARGLELPDHASYEVLAATPLAAQAKRRRAAIEDGDYPSRFPLALACKDADLIRQAAVAAGVQLRVGEAAASWFRDAEAEGRGDRDYTAVLATILAPAGDAANPTPRPAAPCLQSFAYDGLIVDLDGVIWLGATPIDGAAETIAELRANGIRLLFLTNDPQSSAAEQAARLHAIGIPASRSDILTSAAATARYLAAHTALAEADLFAIGSAALHDELRAEGFQLLEPSEARRARAVVVAGHDGFDYAELRAATTAVLAGAQLYATGRDAVFPTRDGPLPATGAILAAVETATGARATVIGKPEPYVFEIARDALAPCERVAVVGDHLVSDIAGAKRAGLEAILVLSGTATEDEIASAPIQPDLILPSLAALRLGRSER